MERESGWGLEPRTYESSQKIGSANPGEEEDLWAHSPSGVSITFL